MCTISYKGSRVERERGEESGMIKERKRKERTQGKKALDVFTDSDSDFHIDQDSDCERSVHADSETHILTHSLCL